MKSKIDLLLLMIVDQASFFQNLGFTDTNS